MNQYSAKLKRTLAYVLTLLMTVSCITTVPSEQVSAAPKKYVKSLKVSPQKKTLKSGTKTTIKASVSVKGSVKKTVKATSSNPKAVTVKTGKANKKGVSKITLTAQPVTEKTTVTVKITTVGKNSKKKKISKSVKITVEPSANAPAVILPESVTATAQSSSIKVGDMTLISAVVAPSNAANKSVTFTSNNPAVATVTNTGAVVGISPGTAVITVQTSNGKTAAVTIQVTEIPVSKVSLPANAEVTITGTTPLTAQVLPENATTKTLTWSSSDNNIATVDNSGVVKGVSEGTVTIRATAQNGIYGECTISVKKSVVEADGITLEVTNPYTDKDGIVYPNTALVGNDMGVRARVIKNGQPVGNTSITLSMERLYGNCGDSFIVRTPTEKTDDNGYVNFIIGLKTDVNLDALSERFQSYLIKAQESASNISKELTIKFASVRVNGIQVLNGTSSKYPDIKPSTSANINDPGIYNTWYIDERKKEEYVTSQQSSSDEGDDNRVYFSASPELLMPVTRETARAEKWEYQVENGASGPCSIYNDETNETTTVQIESIPAGLKYLTLRFDKVDISKYTTMNIDIYRSRNGRNTFHQEVTNTKNGSEIIQIEQQLDEPSYLVISLISQGQVDSSSQGYILKKIEGMWASTNDERSEPEKIQGSVKWTNVSDDLGYENCPWSYTEAREYFSDDSDAYLNPNYTYSYKLPGYPHTGNALITVEDTQGGKTTFLYPTVNNGLNKNILAPADENLHAIMLVNDAVSNKVGDLTTDGDIAIVDSKEVGITSLKASISIDGLKQGALTMDNGGELYTSVHWVNVPNTAEKSTTKDYFAIEGQEVTVTAQLYDKNGKGVAVPNKQITFSYQEDDETRKINLDGTTAGSRASLVNVSNKGATDGNGVVTITFRDITNNEYFSCIEELTASSSDNSYNVRLTFDGTETVKAGNIYWTDIGLTFVDSAVNDDNPVRTTQFNNEVKEIQKPASYTVSDTNKWTVGYQVVARSLKFQYSYLMFDYNDNIIGEYVNVPTEGTNDFVRVSGIPIKYELDNKNVELTEKGNSAELLSTKTGTTKLTGTLNIDEATSANVTFTYINDEGDEVTCKNIGKGKPSSTINTALVLSTKWNSRGTEVNIIAPSLIHKNVSRYVYVNVVDIYGNPIANADVKYVITGVNAREETSAGYTDDNGIAKIFLPIPDDISATSSNVRVTVKDSITENIIITYTDNADSDFTIAPNTTDKPAMEVDPQTKTIEVYFSNNIDTDSIHAGQFKLEAADGTVYTVRSASGGSTSKSLILTLDEEIAQKSIEHTLTIQKYTDDKGMEHILTDRYGQIITEEKFSFKPVDYQSK